MPISARLVEEVENILLDTFLTVQEALDQLGSKESAREVEARLSIEECANCGLWVFETDWEGYCEECAEFLAEEDEL